MKIISKDSAWNFWPTWVVIVILVPVIIYLVIIVHDQFIADDKAHKIWYDSWKESVDNLPCDALKHNMSLEDGLWVHSELYYMYKQRAKELKC